MVAAFSRYRELRSRSMLIGLRVSTVEERMCRCFLRGVRIVWRCGGIQMPVVEDSTRPLSPSDISPASGETRPFRPGHPHPNPLPSRERGHADPVFLLSVE